MTERLRVGIALNLVVKLDGLGKGKGLQEALEDDLSGLFGRVKHVFGVEPVVAEFVVQDFERREIRAARHLAADVRCRGPQTRLRQGVRGQIAGPVPDGRPKQLPGPRAQT